VFPKGITESSLRLERTSKIMKSNLQEGKRAVLEQENSFFAYILSSGAMGLSLGKSTENSSVVTP